MTILTLNTGGITYNGITYNWFCLLLFLLIIDFTYKSK